LVSALLTFFTAHLFLGAIAEARLLLVPYVIVLLPAALLAVQNSPGAAADSKTAAGEASPISKTASE